MRARWFALSFAAVALLLAPLASAQTKEKKTDDTASAAKATKKGAGKARRDPKGVTGISPFWEAVNKGSTAFTAKDYSGAIEAYQEAISKDPKQPLGPYLLGQAQLAAGKADEAEKAWQSALKIVGNNDVLHAKVLFVLADLRERQQNWDGADAAWKEYGSFVSSHAEAKGYANTATERQKAIATRKELATKYGQVKERIQQRNAELAQPPKP